MLRTLQRAKFVGIRSGHAYPFDVNIRVKEWAVVAPCFTLLPETAAEREHRLWEVFSRLRYIVRYGVALHSLPLDLPSRHAVYDQAQRWPRLACFESLVHGLHALLRLAVGRAIEPSAVLLDSWTLCSVPENGARAAWGLHKSIPSSKLHVAVNILGQVLARHVTLAGASCRAAVVTLAGAVQEAAVDSVDLAYADQGYTGECAAKAMADRGIALKIVKWTEAKCAFARTALFRRLVRDYERSPATRAGLHLVAFSNLPLCRAADLAAFRNSL